MTFTLSSVRSADKNIRTFNLNDVELPYEQVPDIIVFQKKNFAATTRYSFTHPCLKTGAIMFNFHVDYNAAITPAAITFEAFDELDNTIFKADTQDLIPYGNMYVQPLYPLYMTDVKRLEMELPYAGRLFELHLKRAYMEEIINPA